MKTPDEEVAQRIVEELRKSKLISDTALDKISQGLSSGKLKPEDWRLAFEIDREIQGEEEDASKG